MNGNVRYWHLADIGLCAAISHVRFAPESGHPVLDEALFWYVFFKTVGPKSTFGCMACR